MLLAFKEKINPIYINLSTRAEQKKNHKKFSSTNIFPTRFCELFYIHSLTLLRIPSSFNSRRATSKENVQVIFLITSSARAADLPGGGARPPARPPALCVTGSVGIPHAPRQEFRRKRLRYLLKFATTTAATAAGALLKRREEFRDCLKDESEREQHRRKTRRRLG